jgi:glucose/arabinose dehydrogenase
MFNRTGWAGAALAGALFAIAGQAVALITNAPAPAAPSRIKVESIATGLEHPWGLQFLPDGRMLVTERPGRLRIVSKDGKLSHPIAGVPEVAAVGQGGLLDVLLAPDFDKTGTIFFSAVSREACSRTARPSRAHTS